MLKPISTGWQWLERTLNGIIDVVNAQHIIPSASVAVQEAPNGVILTVIGGGTAGAGTGGTGGTTDATKGAWRTITIATQDENGRTQLQDMLVWSQPPGKPYPCG